MKTTLYGVFVLFVSVLISPCASGQAGLSDFDSVALTSNSSSNKFKFFDQGAREIKLSSKQPKLVRDKANLMMRDVGNGAMTVLTGIGFSSSADVNWKIEGTIEGNDALSDWIVDLFCEGFREKERERVKNDDGS